MLFRHVECIEKKTVKSHLSLKKYDVAIQDVHQFVSNPWKCLTLFEFTIE